MEEHRELRVAGMLGDDDAVIAAFHACRQALAELGTEPSRTTRDLLDRLRR